NMVLEPCVLGGRCDGRRPSVEPAVVEGAPPVPMEVRNWVIRVQGAGTVGAAPAVAATYPQPDATDVFVDVVPKASFTEPVTRLDANTFTLVDSDGSVVPASAHQIGDGTWGLFPDQVFLRPGATYTVRVSAGICGVEKCTSGPITWRFTVAAQRGNGAGDTTIPMGFPPAGPPRQQKAHN